MPGPPAPRARDHRRAPVEAVTVVILTRPGGPVVSLLLDALAQQSRRPDGIVLTGLRPDDAEVVQAREHPLLAAGMPLTVRGPLSHHPGRGPALGQVVADALTVLPAGAGDWAWLLYDDSHPEPSALEHLIEATRRTSGVGVVGPKLVELDDPRRLIAIGQTLSRGGRPADTALTGQIDQGQYDQRSDVLGVPVAGMFVRTEVLGGLGGFDPAFGDGVEGLDLSWRSHLAGHRVVVAPRAVLRQGRDGLGTVSPWRTRRRTRQVALARGSWWMSPLRACGILVTSLLAGLGLLLVKRPGAAAAELADLTAVLAPWRGWGARWRFRRHQRVGRRHLRGLFESSRGAWRGTTDLVHDALTPRAAQRESRGAVETGPVADEVQSLDRGPDGRAWWSWPLAAAVGLGLLAATVRWRELWPGLSGSSVGVAGGELSTPATGSAGLWHSWWDGWHGPGLGSAAPDEPWLLPMAGATWLVERLPWVSSTADPAALAATWWLFAAVPASVLTGYVAARVVLPSRGGRVLVGLVWAGLPPLSVAVSTGRLGPTVAHVLVPLVVAGFVVSAGRGEAARRTAATFATVLALGLTALFVPGLLLVSSVAGLLLLLLAPGWGRLRGLVLAVCPWLLLGPWLDTAWQDPRLLLGGAGATTTQGRVEAWQTLLLHPGGSPSPALWWTIPILALAVLASTRAGARGARASLALVGAVLGLAAALAASRVAVGTVPQGYSEAGALVTTWPGTYLSLAGACLLLAAAAGADRGGRAGRWATWRRPLLAVVAAVAAVSGTAILAWSTWTGTGPALQVAQPAHPAVVTEQAGGPEAIRLLELQPQADLVRYQLIGAEPGSWVRDRAREISPVTSAAPGPGEAQLEAVTRLLLGHQEVADPDEAAGEGTAETAPGEPTTVQERLHDLAIGYVGLRVPVEHALADELDAVPGLTRLGGSTELLMWRVAALGEGEDLHPPARVRVLDAEGSPLSAVPVTGPHAGVDPHRLTQVPAGATLVISQGGGWSEHVQVRIDGDELVAVPGPWPPSYELTGPGALQIDVLPEHRGRHLSTAVLAGVFAFLALPLGGRRRPR